MISFKDQVRLYTGILNLDLAIPSSCVIGILGDNGIGKSSLLQYFKLQAKKLNPQKSFMYLDQFPIAVLGELSLEDAFEMLEKLYPQRFRGREFTKKIIAFFDFTQKQSRPINMLSGGENQVCKVILSLSISADLYFLDEPLSYLDKEKQKVLIELIELLKSEGRSFIIIEHRRDILEQISDECFLMKRVSQRTIELGKL